MAGVEAMRALTGYCHLEAPVRRSRAYRIPPVLPTYSVSPWTAGDPITLPAVLNVHLTPLSFGTPAASYTPVCCGLARKLALSPRAAADEMRRAIAAMLAPPTATAGRAPIRDSNRTRNLQADLCMPPRYVPGPVSSMDL